jgi:hypothetical protein
VRVFVRFTPSHCSFILSAKYKRTNGVLRYIVQNGKVVVAITKEQRNTRFACSLCQQWESNYISRDGLQKCSSNIDFDKRKIGLQTNLNTAGLPNPVKTQIDPVMQQTMLHCCHELSALTSNPDSMVASSPLWYSFTVSIANEECRCYISNQGLISLHQKGKWSNAVFGSMLWEMKALQIATTWDITILKVTRPVMHMVSKTCIIEL